MSSRFFRCAIAAAAVLATGAAALAQGRVYDRNASNNPEVYQQTHPDDRSNPQLQGPPARGVEPPSRTPRDAGRTNDRRDQGREARRDDDRRQRDRNNRDRRGNDRRDDGYGYVVPRSNFYYGAPPVYFAPPVYYGGVPQPYYNPYAYSPPQVFRPGDYLPPEYLDAQFVVLDWQWRGLPAPSYGYQWMLLGPGNYALVAMNTGQIVSVVVGR